VDVMFDYKKEEIYSCLRKILKDHDLITTITVKNVSASEQDNYERLYFGM